MEFTHLLTSLKFDVDSASTSHYEAEHLNSFKKMLRISALTSPRDLVVNYGSLIELEIVAKLGVRMWWLDQYIGQVVVRIHPSNWCLCISFVGCASGSWQFA